MEKPLWATVGPSPKRSSRTSPDCPKRNWAIYAPAPTFLRHRWLWGIDSLALLVERASLACMETIYRWPLGWAKEIDIGQRLANIFYEGLDHRLYSLCCNY